MFSFKDSKHITFSVSAILWTPLLLFSLYCTYEQQQHSRPWHRAIMLLMSASVALRLCWFVLYADHGDEQAPIAINRVSLLLQCTSVLSMLLLWLRRMVTNKKHFRWGRNTIVPIFSVIWIIIIASCFTPRNDDWYRVNLILIGVSSFVISFLALCYGLAARYKMKTTRDEDMLLSSDYSKRKTFTRRLICVCLALSLCFGFRAFLFSASSLSYRVDGLYPWFYYHVPEVIPLLVLAIELSPQNGILIRLWNRSGQGGAEAGASLDEERSTRHEYPRPSSITMHTIELDTAFYRSTEVPEFRFNDNL